MLYLDTSVLVPLFVPEPPSQAVRKWFDAHAGDILAISDWTLTEFASAMGIKVRDKGLKAHQAEQACALMDELAQDSLRVLTPTRADYRTASSQLGHHALGLRAGDALHLAVAHNQGAERLYTLDKRLITAARKLRLRVASPI